MESSDATEGAATRRPQAIERLRNARGEVVAAVSAGLLFLFMFLPWFGTKHEVTETGFPLPARDVTVNAWRSFGSIDIILLIVVVVAVGSAALARSGRTQREALLGILTTLVGLLATALVVYRVIEPLTSTEREYGLFLGLVAAVGILAGGVLWMRQLGPTGMIDARNQLADLIASGERADHRRPPPEGFPGDQDERRQ